tara:strand:+ start:405 stop:545 length:141 start_codon:yes stop_codon:yes gene_type:complete
MRSVGMYGGNGSIMIANIIVGICMSTLVVGIVYGLYMAIWGVYEEY